MTRLCRTLPLVHAPHASVRLSVAGKGAGRPDAHLWEREGGQPAARRRSSRAVLVPSRVILGNILGSKPPQGAENVHISVYCLTLFAQNRCKLGFIQMSE